MLTGLIPIGDDNTDRLSAPVVTYLLIAANVLVFFFLQVPNPAFTYGYSVIPVEITRGIDLVAARPATGGGMIPEAPGPSPIYLTLFTAMFMHGGFMHLAGNMLYLWIFGDNVEEALGTFKFLLFYLICGLVAAFAQIFAAPSSPIPSLGASGAIAGVLGGYLVLYPARRVRVLVGYLGIIELPAILVIGFWIVVQFMNGFGSIAFTRETETGGVAYWAHIGGAVAGLLLVSLFRSDGVRQRALQRQTYPVRRSFYD